MRVHDFSSRAPCLPRRAQCAQCASSDLQASEQHAGHSYLHPIFQINVRPRETASSWVARTRCLK
eukprot:3704108-Amphidinium_carterae.1